MEKEFLPQIENVNIQRGFKSNNVEKGKSSLIENLNDFSKHPFTSFGYIHFKHKITNQKYILAQAVLIGPSHILTSARSLCNFIQNNNLQNDDILNQGELQFYCGQELNIVAGIAEIFYNKEIIQSSKSYDSQDFAMCMLDNEIGNKQGYLGIITPLHLAFFEEIQFKQQNVLIYDSQSVLFGQICDVDTKEMLLQFKNEQGQIMNSIDQEINLNEEDQNSINENDHEESQDIRESINNNDQNIKENKKINEKGQLLKNNSIPAIFNKILFIYDKIFGYVVLSADVQKNGLYYKSQFLTTFHLYQMVFWYQGILINPKDQANKIPEMKFLENKGNIKVEEPADQDDKPIVCLKQLNNQFIFTGNQDSSANFWHLGSLNIGQTVQREIFEYNFRNSKFNGIIDIISEGYYGIALVGRYVILLNWLNFELLEAKEFNNELTCIYRRQERFKYFVGDNSGEIIYLNLNCENLQLEEDSEGSIKSKSQRNSHGHDKAIDQMHLIKEKQQLVVASLDGIRLWDIRSRKLVANIEGNQNKPVTFLGYSKARLYVAGQDHNLRVYDLAGKLYRTIRFQYPISCGIFLNSSELALSEGKNLKIINVISNDQDFYSVHKYNITNICRISDLQFVTADTKGCLYRWSLMPNESDPSLQYRVALELSNSSQALGSIVSPQHLNKFFSSNLSPQRPSFHSQKFQQMKANIETNRNLANQGIYEGSQKMVGDLYVQENYYLKAKVRNLENKVSQQKGEYSESHRDFIQNSSFSRINQSATNISASNKSSMKDNTSQVALKAQKAQIKAMEQKLKEQEELVQKIQQEEQLLSNNAEIKVKQEKKVYMEKSVDDIKLNSQRFESKIPLIQNDINLLRKQLSFINESLTDRQTRIRDRSNSLQKKQSDIQQFHNQIQQRDQAGQEELLRKKEQIKLQREQELRQYQQQQEQLQNDHYNMISQNDQIQDGENQEEFESVRDDQMDLISQELDQTIKNSQNFINSQRNLQSSQMNRQPNNVASGIDDCNDSQIKASQDSSRIQHYKNDDINNSNGSSGNSCVLNNKLLTNSLKTRNLMKINRDDSEMDQLQDDDNNNNNNQMNQKEMLLLLQQKRGSKFSDIQEEEQDSYKYTNRRSSPNSIYQNSQMLNNNGDQSERNHQKSQELSNKNNKNSNANNKSDNLDDKNINNQDNLSYNQIEQQFKILQEHISQLQQNYQELKTASLSPRQNMHQQLALSHLPPTQIIYSPQQIKQSVYQPGEFKPILRLQQMSPDINNNNNNINESSSPTQFQPTIRINQFVGQQQSGYIQQQTGRHVASPPPGYTQITTTRSLSPNILIANSQIANNSNNYQNQIANSPVTQMINTSTSFCINASPPKNVYPSQISQTKVNNNNNNNTNTASPQQIRLLNTSMNGNAQNDVIINLGNSRSPTPQLQSSSQYAIPPSNSAQSKRSQSVLSQNNNNNNNNNSQIRQSDIQQSSNLNNNSGIIQVIHNKSINLQHSQQFDNAINGKINMQQPLLQMNQDIQSSQTFIQNEQSQQQQQQIKSTTARLSTASHKFKESQQDIQKQNNEIRGKEEIQKILQENEEIKQQLMEQSNLMQELQLLLEKQKEEIQQRDQIITTQKLANQLQQQQMIEQENINQQNIATLSEQIIKQSQIIHSFEQQRNSFEQERIQQQFQLNENQLLQQQLKENIQQLERDKMNLLNKINNLEMENQQKSNEILQSENNNNQINIAYSQLKQLTTYDEVEKLIQNKKIQENIIEQLRNEQKILKQQLFNQEQQIVDSQRLEQNYQQNIIQIQQLSNENSIYKSKISILENDNKNLHLKMLSIREEIDQKYQTAIYEFQKLMQGHSNKQINLQQSIENIKNGVLTGVDINALDKLIEISNKKAQQQSYQNVRNSQNLSASQYSNNGQLSDRNNHFNNTGNNNNRMSEKYQDYSPNNRQNNNYNNMGNSSQNQFQNIYSLKNKQYDKILQQQQSQQHESNSSIKTFNPDIHGKQFDDDHQIGQNKSLSPLNNKNNNYNQGTQRNSNFRQNNINNSSNANNIAQQLISSQQYNKNQQQEMNQQQIRESDSIKTFVPPEGQGDSLQSDENTESDYFSSVQFVSGQGQQRKSAFKNNQQKHSPRELTFNQNIDEINEKKQRNHDDGICSQQ